MKKNKRYFILGIIVTVASIYLYDYYKVDLTGAYNKTKQDVATNFKVRL